MKMPHVCMMLYTIICHCRILPFLAPTTIPWRHHFPYYVTQFPSRTSITSMTGGTTFKLYEECVKHSNPNSCLLVQIPCYYYQLAYNDKEWRCRKCMQLKSKNGGWTNLLSHLVKSCIGKDYVDQYMLHAASIQIEQIAVRSGTSVGSTGSMLLDAFCSASEWRQKRDGPADFESCS